MLLYAGQVSGIPVIVKIQTAFSVDPFDGFITNNRNQLMLCLKLIYNIAVQRAHLFTADLEL